MSAMSIKMPEYMYVSSNKRVKLLLVDKNDGIIRLAADVKSESRPNVYHHARVEIGRNGCVRFSCSCEAGTYGYMCHHVMEVFNLFRKNAKNLLSQRSYEQRGER